jgi:hypothetical protein
VLLRQFFQLPGSCTPADQGCELLHVGKRFANCGEGTVETGMFDLGLDNPLGKQCWNAAEYFSKLVIDRESN